MNRLFAAAAQATGAASIQRVAGGADHPYTFGYCPMKHLIRHPVSSEKLRLLYGISVERALELDEAALKVLDLKANGQRAHLHKAVRRARKSAKARGAKTRRATAA
jgi:hypothetical protein